MTNEITSATLTSSVISLPSGTYYIDAAVNHYATQVSNESPHQLKVRLRNTSGSADLLIGQGTGTAVSNSAPSTDTITVTCSYIVPIKGRFTLAGTTNIEVQTYSGFATTLGGIPYSAPGLSEVYADVMIWKVA